MDGRRNDQRRGIQLISQLVDLHTYFIIIQFRVEATRMKVF